MSNYKEEMSTSHHPFHPRKGQPARPMRSYESIKKELAGKAKSESLKNKIAKKIPKYGDKRDYPKIDVYVNGVYKHSTNWARNLKEAKEKSGVTDGKISAKYSK